jgi:hypothetical protein
MSMEETETPRPKRKYVRKAKAKVKARKPVRRAAVSEPDAPDITFPGLTETLCAAACGPDGCVISGNSYCGHPRKGGLQAGDIGNQDALRRIQQAAKQLGMKAMEKKYA